MFFIFYIQNMKKNLIVPLAFVAIWSIMVFSSLTFASTTTVKNKSNESADHKRPILSWAIWSGNHKPFSGDFETWDRRPPFSGDFGTWDHKPFSGDFGTWDHKKPLSGNKSSWYRHGNNYRTYKCGNLDAW